MQFYLNIISHRIVAFGVVANITFYLLLGFGIPVVRSLPRFCSDNPSPPECPDDCDGNRYYVGGDGLCKMCLNCGPGEELNKPCGNGRNGDAVCKPCDEDTFSPGWDHECVHCRICVNTVELTACSSTGDRECGDCLPGFFRGASQFFDPGACPDSCAHADPDEPQCREWWQQQQQTTTMLQEVKHPPLQPQDTNNEAEQPRQIKVAPETPNSDAAGIPYIAENLEQQASLTKDETSQGIPYLTIIAILAILLVIVIVVFSLAFVVVLFRRSRRRFPSEIKEVEGHLLADSPRVSRISGSTPGTPQIDERLANPGFHAKILRSKLEHSSRPVSSDVSSTTSGFVSSSESSSAASTPKLPKYTLYKLDTCPIDGWDDASCDTHERNIERSTVIGDRDPTSSVTKVVREGPGGTARAYATEGQTFQRRRSSATLPENATPRRPSVPLTNESKKKREHWRRYKSLSIKDGKELEAALFSESPDDNVKDGKELEAALFSESPNDKVDKDFASTAGEIKQQSGPAGPGPTASGPRSSVSPPADGRPTASTVGTNPTTPASASGSTQHQKTCACQNSSPGDQLNTKPSIQSKNGNHGNSTGSPLVRIVVSGVNCKKIQIGDEHHHSAGSAGTDRLLATGNSAESYEDGDGDEEESEEDEVDQLLHKH